MAGVEHQFAEVVGESSLVGIEGFLAAVFASVVDGDADGAGELCSKSYGFDFCEGESASEFGAVAVADGLAADGGSELVEGTGG